MVKTIEDENEKKKYLDHYNWVLEDVGKNKEYSVQRFDYIIVFISAASIFLLTNLISEYKLSYCNCGFLFKLAIILFTASIASNLIGQYLAYQTSHNLRQIFIETRQNLIFLNKVDADALNNRIREEMKIAKAANSTNIISLVLVVLGLALSVLAYWALL